jgi:hypothetical protein
MFTLAYERRCNVLLTTFSSVFSSEDISGLDLAVIRFTANHGPAHLILDYRSVESVGVPMSKWLRRSRQPAISPEFKRFLVVRDADGSELFQMARVFTTQQRMAGSSEPQVVSSLDDALLLLGATDAIFEPVASGPHAV